MADGTAADAMLMSVLRSATSDPGKAVARRMEPVLEPLPMWQARAVAVALAAAGLCVVPAAEMERLRAPEGIEWGVRHSGAAVPYPDKAHARRTCAHLAEHKPHLEAVLVWREKARPAGDWHEEAATKEGE